MRHGPRRIAPLDLAARIDKAVFDAELLDILGMMLYEIIHTGGRDRQVASYSLAGGGAAKRRDFQPSRRVG